MLSEQIAHCTVLYDTGIYYPGLWIRGGEERRDVWKEDKEGRKEGEEHC